MKEKNFQESTHTIGRMWTIAGLLLFIAVPLVMMAAFDVSPDIKGIIAGTISICVIYLPSSIVEVLTYAPMLGSGATYLAFLTGNLVNLKIPCAANARDIAKTEFGTEENEIISTISVASSTIVTTLVIALGVLLLAPLTPIISSPQLAPVFANVVPALFGALAFKHFSNNPKLVIVPLALCMLLVLIVPAITKQVAMMVPLAAVASMASAYFMYKKNMV